VLENYLDFIALDIRASGKNVLPVMIREYRKYDFDFQRASSFPAFYSYLASLPFL
jgi:hypothetical protein